MKNSKRRLNRRSSVFALIGICLIFGVIVGRGWQGLASSFGFTIALIVGVLVALIAMVLAWAIADEWINSPDERATRWAYFFVLLNISALGTLNAMFLTFQASNLFREESEIARLSVGQLKDAGMSYLTPRLAEFDKLEGDVKTVKTKLIDELLNPQNCGQGTVALTYANELKALIGFQANSGTPDCRTATAVAKQYDKKIPELLLSTNVYLKAQTDIDLRKKLLDFQALSYQDLSEINKMASQVAKPVPEMKILFFKVAERYSAMKAEFGTRLPSQAVVPERIDTSAISALGDIGQIWPFLMSRLDKLPTYFYLLIAVFLEVTVILSFRRVLSGEPTPRRGINPSQNPAGL